VALFSLQLVVIQPFPLDLFTTTNNNQQQHQHLEKDGEQRARLSINSVCSSVQRCVALVFSRALFVCFLPAWLPAVTTYRLFRLPGHDMGGREEEGGREGGRREGGGGGPVPNPIHRYMPR